MDLLVTTLKKEHHQIQSKFGKKSGPSITFHFFLMWTSLKILLKKRTTSLPESAWPENFQTKNPSPVFGQKNSCPRMSMMFSSVEQDHNAFKHRPWLCFFPKQSCSQQSVTRQVWQWLLAYNLYYIFICFDHNSQATVSGSSNCECSCAAFQTTVDCDYIWK